MMITISSQHYRDEDIVKEKIINNDFVVAVSPEFKHDGIAMRVIADGHHSYEAAKRCGAAVQYVESESDWNALIQRGETADFLEGTWIDGPYYNVEIGEEIW